MTSTSLVEAIMFVRTCDTGAEPLLLQGDNEKFYWCKGPENPHGNLSLANEWVIAELSRHLDAPVPPSALVQVSADLLDGRTYRDGRRMRAGLWFGSRVIEGYEDEAIDRIRSDNNPQRIARYLALWYLCLGTDPQFLYEVGSDHSLWSIDHGLWFDSLEPPGDRPSLWGTPADIPWDGPEWRTLQRCDAEELVAAAETVDAIPYAILREIVQSIPLEWGVSQDERGQLADFLFKRRMAVAQQLRSLVTRLGG